MEIVVANLMKDFYDSYQSGKIEVDSKKPGWLDKCKSLFDKDKIFT